MEGVCTYGSSSSLTLRVTLGSADHVKRHIADPSLAALVDAAAAGKVPLGSGGDKARRSKAMAFLTAVPVATAAPLSVVHRQEVVMFCLEDVVQPGVRRAIKSLRTGRWMGKWGTASDAKHVVMLTGQWAQVEQ